ncbi:MAG: LysE family transporter [Armatimonadota bacterium]|nr:LysE family transporter [Armatimonadota bacterium]MDR7448444.1 LysE family transporter [Armatimonadota bacterium]MDR7459546.1 LysE family transporter [Armatimonadota bacterium]MDR7480366.1 LysE family transporter [Armatimonadota bacterium]MDR7488287.1 LysE family transporter [Armatimonadota bacterium]
MAELWVISLTWWMVSLSGVLMPGPVSAMAITEGARRGPAAGPLLTAGHALAEGAMLGALAAGVSTVLRQPGVVGVVGLLGGVVLAWMGWGILRAALRGEVVAHPATAGEAAGETASRAGPAHLVRAGLVVTAGNPYWLLWWATVGTSYFLLFTRFGPLAIFLFFFIGHLALDLGWNTLLATLVGTGRGRIPPAVYRVVVGVAGLFVLAVSVYFVISGLRFLTA